MAMDAATIAAILAGHAVRSMGGNYVVRCPCHDDRTPSLSIRDGDDGNLLVRCFAGCDPVNVLAEIRARVGNTGERVEAAPPPLKGSRDYERRQRDKAQWMWTQRKAPYGTVVEKYLRVRGITGEIPPTLGYLPPRKPGHHPAMIAAFGVCKESESGLLLPPSEVTAVHITKLQNDGAGKAGEPNKIVVGSPGGKPITIAPPTDNQSLLIVEGIEEALSYHSVTNVGVWAAGAAPFMPKMAESVPDYISHVTVFADRDPAGERNANLLQQNLLARRIFVEVRPTVGDATHDANDVLREQGPEALRNAFDQAMHATPHKSNGNASGIGAGIMVELFDPWQQLDLPAFPLDVLPPQIGEFITAQSIVIGCDASAFTMAVLGAFGGALDHRFAVRMMRHGKWWASPRLWILLAGDPSCKKTPVINAATDPLEQYQNELREKYARELDEYEIARANGDDVQKPKPPPRFVIWDTTTEKLGELLANSPRGLLVKRDELSGWIGSMERYGSGGARGASADRGFWLQAYNGGPYTFDRITRGEVYIKNLSVTLIGGIQPDRLAELRGLTTDGLLQRFVPVMMNPPTLPLDQECDDEQYTTLIRALIFAEPQRLIFTDGALEIMRALERQLYDVEQTSHGLATGFQGFVGKLAGIAGTLALILHMASNPAQGAFHPIGEATATSVHRLVTDFILKHGYEFYRGSSASDPVQKVASFILTNGKPRVVASDFTTNVSDMRGLGVVEINKRLSPLEAAGWLEPSEPKLGHKNRAWNVRPEVFACFEARARIEEARKSDIAKLMGSPRKIRME
jgi:uncharacterized protein DUF3987/Toprim domain-containing protein